MNAKTTNTMTQNQSSLVIFIAGTIMVIGGIHGIVKRKTISNHAHLVLSVGQLISGIISLAAFTIIHFGITTR